MRRGKEGNYARWMFNSRKNKMSEELRKRNKKNKASLNKTCLQSQNTGKKE